MELIQISKFIPEVKDRYYINRNGELFTDNGEKKMKDALKNGYVKNCLTLKDGTQRFYFRHRLVMRCFNPIDNFEDLQVNHKDGNKLNNNLDNLEWCTTKENAEHARDILKISYNTENAHEARKIKINVLNENKEIIQRSKTR